MINPSLIGRLVLTSKLNGHMGIVVKETNGPGCKHYFIKLPDGTVKGPFLNHELIDLESNSRINS
jgi:hypothetical protein